MNSGLAPHLFSGRAVLADLAAEKVNSAAGGVSEKSAALESRV
jgi:hypothetical protein